MNVIIQKLRHVAPHRRVVPDPETVFGDTGPRTGRCVRPPGLPGRQDPRTRLTVKKGNHSSLQFFMTEARSIATQLVTAVFYVALISRGQNQTRIPKPWHTSAFGWSHATRRNKSDDNKDRPYRIARGR